MASTEIFIIWDDVDMIKLFTFFFEKNGYTTDSAYSFEDGLATCLHQPPKLLIIRRTLKSQDDGLGFCQEIRATPILAHIPVIVGYADLPPSWIERVDAYQQAYEAGANACFGRVYDITDVLEEVKILLTDPTITHLVDRQTLWLNQQKTKRQ